MTWPTEHFSLGYSKENAGIGREDVKLSQLSEKDCSTQLNKLFEEFNRSDAPGVIVGVSCGEEFSYRRGFGLASVQHGIANTTQTRTRFASITKQFTSLALLLLAEEGKVDIDAPVSKYLPHLNEPLGQATLRQFMTHTSGIRCTLEMGSVANGFAVQPSGWQLEALYRQKSTQYASNEEQLYCNGTFVAISDIIEKFADTSFDDFVKERIFVPLGMFDSEIVADDTIMVPGMAAAHVRDGKHWKRPQVDTEIGGDGGIVSTVDDMLRWLAHLRGTKCIGSQETWQTFLEPCVLNRGFQTTYAMGIKRHAYRGVEVIQHSGGLFGLNAQIITVPQFAIDVVVAVNGAPASATRLAFSVIDICLADTFVEPPPKRATSRDYNHLLNQCFGHPSGLVISFGDVDGLLGLSQMHMHPAPVIYEDDKTLTVLFEEIGFGPLVWSKAALSAFTPEAGAELPVTIAGKACNLTWLPAAAGTLEETLEPALGSYFSEELLTNLELGLEAGQAIIRIKGDYSAVRNFRVSPVSERYLRIVSYDGNERYSIELDTATDGLVLGLWIDTHRARRMHFKKVDETQS